MQFLRAAAVVNTYEDPFFEETGRGVFVGAESWHPTTALEISNMEVLLREWQNWLFQSNNQLRLGWRWYPLLVCIVFLFWSMTNSY